LLESGGGDVFAFTFFVGAAHDETAGEREGQACYENEAHRWILLLRQYRHSRGRLDSLPIAGLGVTCGDERDSRGIDWWDGAGRGAGGGDEWDAA
jgi:hypothetical protein